jgi:nucleoside 2-deoxyribosyltransferase
MSGPVDASNPCIPPQDRTVRTVPRGSGQPKVYCAGPMFSPGEKWEAVQIAQRLDNHKFEVFLPQEDGIELKKLVDLVSVNGDLLPLILAFNPAMRHAIYCLDFYLVLEWCDALVFNMNGRVPDEGGVVEVTGAYMSGKAVVLYKETPVAFISGEDNPMIDGLDPTFYNVASVDGIPAEVQRALDLRKAAHSRSGYRFQPPPNATAAMELGRLIWNMRLALEPKGGKGWTANDLMPLIVAFPYFIAQDIKPTVDAEGRIFFPTAEGSLEIGILPTGFTQELKDSVLTLWNAFSDRVYVTMHAQAHKLNARDPNVIRSYNPDCSSCRTFGGR